MLDELQKNVLITGSAVRVGKYLAEKLAQDGWSIALHYHASEQEAYELAKNLLPITNVMLFQADLTNQEESASLIDKINKQLGPVKLIINNASIYKNDNLSNLSAPSIEKHFAIHLNTVIYLAQKMAAQGINGDIINIIDSDISHNTKKFFSYNLSKKSLFNATQMLALSLAPCIKVNAIAPGPILFKEGQNLSLFNDMIKQSPLGKVLDLQELYDSIDFLVKSKSITGQVIYLDNGRHLL